MPRSDQLPESFGAKVLSVRHTGSVIPRGTTRLTTLPEKVKVLDTHGYGTIISLLEKWR